MEYVLISLKDLNNRIETIEGQMEILKENQAQSYALSKMYLLLIELRDTHRKIYL